MMRVYRFIYGLFLFLLLIPFAGCSGNGSSGNGSFGNGSSDPPSGDSMLLYSSMNSAEEVFQPTYASGLFGSLEEALPGLSQISFENGLAGNAPKFLANTGDRFFNGMLRYHGDNFDFADVESDGGRVDFWLKFNTDPHTTTANTWVARSNYGASRFINFEFAGSGSNPPDFYVDFYSDVGNTYRTNYSGFAVQPRNWDVYENIREGEWHQFTILWRRNGGPDKAELHIFIDGTQEGCKTCSDFGGNLPPAGGVTQMVFSPDLYENFIPFSMDEIYSFSSWDVSGASGAFADLTLSNKVMMKFPQLNAYPTWGCPIPVTDATDVVFEFNAVNNEAETFECDLYVDDAYVGSATTTTMAHTEILRPGSLTEGDHTYQVKCDDDRIVSDAVLFRVVNELPGGCVER